MSAAAHTLDLTPEYAFTDAHFALLRTLVMRHASIDMGEVKRPLVYGRLARRIRALELSGFDAYCDLLTREHGAETENFVNAITTNLTSFFRENHHFEYLAETVVPRLQKIKATTRKIRIWSAGCSTGEEPYSIAMTVLEALADCERWDVEILATDIDSSVVATAAAGSYPPSRQQGVGDLRARRWFSHDDRAPGQLQAKRELHDVMRFAQLNLMDRWPLKGPFDAIFCRNVAIYFDQPTRSRLFDRFADVLAPHGHLFIGHAETMFGTCARWSCDMPAFI